MPAPPPKGRSSTFWCRASPDHFRSECTRTSTTPAFRARPIMLSSKGPANIDGKSVTTSTDKIGFLAREKLRLCCFLGGRGYLLVAKTGALQGLEDGVGGSGPHRNPITDAVHVDGFGFGHFFGSKGP